MVFEQATSSDVWEVKHNLNTLTPVIECWVDTEEIKTRILPLNIEVKDENTAVIHFTRQYTGYAKIHKQKRWSDE